MIVFLSEGTDWCYESEVRGRTEGDEARMELACPVRAIVNVTGGSQPYRGPTREVI